MKSPDNPLPASSYQPPSLPYQPSRVPTQRPQVPQQQGQQANFNGSATERDIRHRLLDHGYILRRDVASLPTSPYFVMQCRAFRNLVGDPWKVDFFVFHPVKWPDGLIIESKYQQCSGSADEKLINTLLSLLQIGIPARLVLQGRGARLSYVNWCRRQAEASPCINDRQQLCVWSWDEMIAELNRGFL